MPTRLVLLVATLGALAGTDRLSAAGPTSFRNDVMAVLSRAGCNSGPCHGNLNGKGGFRLSLRGENPEFDLAALTRDMLARRTDPADPDESLVLKKASGRVPHEGGARFAVRSPEYAILKTWIAAGCRADSPGTPRLTRLEVTPGERILVAPVDRVTLTVSAHYTDGSTRIVTGLAAFDTTNLGVAKVRSTGEVVREQFGESVVLVRYLDRQVPVRLAFIPDRPVPSTAILDSGHPIDALVAEQLKALRLPPSPVCSDEVFVRRAYLDACGILPAPDVVRAFLGDRATDKREKLIDQLLTRPEFAEFWAMKWSDLLRNEEKSLDRKGVQVFHRWMKGWFVEDKPLTEFAREILAARGSTYQNPPANFYRAVREPYGRAEAVAQVFLGIRVGCAKCHNHPFDRWTQDDYHRLAAFFPRVEYRVLENNRRDTFDKHEFVGEQVVYTTRAGEVMLPRTGADAAPKFLGAPTPDLTGAADRLGALADWVADPHNPFFSRAQANRIWFHLTGRGLVDPNDDFRVSNPASNPLLLDHLAGAFAAGGFRVKPLVRHVMTSRTYQLASSPVPGNETDETHSSHALVQPLEAEQLLDALIRALDTGVKFTGYPDGTRAGALPAMAQTVEGRRGKAPAAGERFMKVFGKPDRLLTCECERTEDAGLIQAFQLITGPLVHRMLSESDNRIGRMLSSGKPTAEVLDELYLASVCRYPTGAEKEKLLTYVGAATDKRAAWEDVSWGLVNAKEFLLRR
jgi:hypothetical protein